MKLSDHALVFLVSAIVGSALLLVWEKHSPAQRPIDLEPRECVQACIKAMLDNKVFPDFSAIVKECDARYGDGCKLIEGQR